MTLSKLVPPLLMLMGSAVACAEESVPPDDALPEQQPMTGEYLGALVQSVDEAARREGNSWQFTVAELDALVVYDEAADRMRIIIPIGRADALEAEELMRLMQANFDSALDARYAVGQGLLWGTFIHPLSSLTEEEFLVGLGQTANVVLSFGTSYSSGLLQYNGGDSEEIEQQRLIDELKKKSRT